MSLRQHPLSLARHQSCSLILSTQIINQWKTKSYCVGLHTHNPGIREVNFESISKRLVAQSTSETRKKHLKENNSYRWLWTHIYIPALTEVHLEPGLKRGNNRNRTVVRLYWLSWSLHLKQSQPNLTLINQGLPYQIGSN